MSQSEADYHALRTEWIVARAVLVLGIVACGAFFIWLGMHRAPSITSTDTGATTAPASNVAQSGASDSDSQAHQFCRSTVAVAQSFGTIPSAAQPDGVAPQRTDVRGRYVCVAQAGSDRYTIAVDLMCRDLGDERCFNLFNVSKSDGSVLFQRQS